MHSPSCLKWEYFPAPFRKAQVRPSSQALSTVQDTLPILRFFYTLLGKTRMFSANEILSLLETLKILPWRQVFTPKAYITNLVGPTSTTSSVTDRQFCIQTGRKPLPLEEVCLPKWPPFLLPQNYAAVASTPSDHRTGRTKNRKTTFNNVDNGNFLENFNPTHQVWCSRIPTWFRLKHLFFLLLYNKILLWLKLFSTGLEIKKYLLQPESPKQVSSSKVYCRSG